MVKVLDYQDWRIVKIIRLEKQFGPRFLWADVVYTRNVTTSYYCNVEKVQTDANDFFDVKKVYPEDQFDKIILKAAKQNYPNAHFVNADICVDLEIDWIKKRFRNQHKEFATIYIEPYLNENDYGIYYKENREFPIFTIPLDIYVPSPDFNLYFSNEVFFLNYNISKEDELRRYLNEIKKTFHELEEIIR